VAALFGGSSDLGLRVVMVDLTMGFETAAVLERRWCDGVDESEGREEPLVKEIGG
jgi:hypothetical protein